jgi:hypothetical protein
MLVPDFASLTPGYWLELLQGRRTRTVRLCIHLVPKPLWGRNLRDGLGKARWDRLRQTLIETKGACCAICGSTLRLHGHEVWAYREKKSAGTAVLMKVEIICIDCHDIRHFARTTKLFQAGIIKPERYGALRKHFRNVNGCRQQVFDDHFTRSLRAWARRSKKRWRVDYGPYGEQVEIAKAARAKWAQAHCGSAIETQTH